MRDLRKSDNADSQFPHCFQSIQRYLTQQYNETDIHSSLKQKEQKIFVKCFQILQNNVINVSSNMSFMISQRFTIELEFIQDKKSLSLNLKFIYLKQIPQGFSPNFVNSDQLLQIIKVLQNDRRTLTNNNCKNHDTKQKIINILMSKKNIILGGGCGSSRSNIDDIKKIQKITPQTQVENGDSDCQSEENEKLQQFNQKYIEWTDKDNFLKNVKSSKKLKSQIHYQHKIFLECIQENIELFKGDAQLYRLKIIDIFDMFIFYHLISTGQKEVLMESEIKELGSKIEDFQKFLDQQNNQQPILDLTFFTEIIYKLNQSRIEIEQKNNPNLDKVGEFIIKIFQVGKGQDSFSQGNFGDLDKISNGVKECIHYYQQKEVTSFLHLQLEVWLEKVEKFTDQIWNIPIEEEIQFYITKFNQLNQLENTSDLILLTLIRIDYLLEKIFNQISSSNELNPKKSLSGFQEKNSAYISLKSDLIKVFVSKLIQSSEKSYQDERYKNWINYSVTNPRFRFTIISILLKFRMILNANSQENPQEQDQIFQFLCCKYLCEQLGSVKILFKSNDSFINEYNEKVENEEFKQKIVLLDKKRKSFLKEFLSSQNIKLSKFEKEIDLADISLKIMENSKIENWRRKINERQKLQIARKDDSLLEIMDFYINQKLIYTLGDNFLDNNKSALECISQNFLKTERCKILSIIGQGGAGKSMLVKKLELELIKSLSQEEGEQGNKCIPILILCNQLDTNQPSIEDYLQKHTDIQLKKDEILSLKQSERIKLLILDGFDEFSGDCFRVYQKLDLINWKNTKVIITSRQEKFSIEDFQHYFSIDDENGRRDEQSYCIVELDEFQHEDIIEYSAQHFKSLKQQEQKSGENIKIMNEIMQNIQTAQLLKLPINLYFLTRRISNIKNNEEIKYIIENISEQTQLQENYLDSLFDREAQDFIDTYINDANLITKKEFKNSIKASYFEYFQEIAILMFLQKGKENISNFMEIKRSEVGFQLKGQIKSFIKEDLQSKLYDKITNYQNSTILTIGQKKLGVEASVKNKMQKVNQSTIQFKHKSLFEYFAAKAMKYEFDLSGESISTLKLKELAKFNINQKPIMQAGQNQSEQQILVKLYQLIWKEIHTEEFYRSIEKTDIKEMNRYVQYIKMSKINLMTQVSELDIGASNLLSVLFMSNFSYDNLDLSSLSFSRAYIPHSRKPTVNVSRSNLSKAYIENSNMDFVASNISNASQNKLQQSFDTDNYYSTNKIEVDDQNRVYSLSKTGVISVLEVVNQKLQLIKYNQITFFSLKNIIVQNKKIYVSSMGCLFELDYQSLQIVNQYRFNKEIQKIVYNKKKKEIILSLINQQMYSGNINTSFTKLQQTGWVQDISPDDQFLVTSTWDFKLIVSAIEKNYEQMHVLEGPESEINSAVFSPNGRFLVSGGCDDHCCVWDVQKNFLRISRFHAHYWHIIPVAFSADSLQFATGCYDCTFSIWRSETQEQVVLEQSHQKRVHTLVYTKDNKYFLTGSQDNTIKLWNKENYENIDIYSGHEQGITAIALSSNNKYIASGSQDCIKIWIYTQNYTFHKSLSSQQIIKLQFIKQDKILLSVSEESVIYVWSVDNDFQLMKQYQLGDSYPKIIQISESQDQMLSGNEDHTITVYNISNNNQVSSQQILRSHTDQITGLSFSPDSQNIATCSLDTSCIIWKRKQNKYEEIKTIRIQEQQMHYLAYSQGKDMALLALALGSNEIVILNCNKDYAITHTISNISSYTHFIEFSRNNKYLLSGSEGKYYLWNIDKSFDCISKIDHQSEDEYNNYGVSIGTFCKESDKIVIVQFEKFQVLNIEKSFETAYKIYYHDQKVNSIAFSEDSKYLATASRICQVWNVQKEFEREVALYTSGEICAIAFSFNNLYLAAGTSDHKCNIYDVQNKFELVHIIDTHSDVIASLSFSSNNLYLATGSWDGSFYVWNTQDQFKVVKHVIQNSGQVSSIAFSHDCKYLASGTADNSCQIWDVQENFKLVTKLQKDDKQIRQGIFTRDNKYFLTVSNHVQCCLIWDPQNSFQLIGSLEGHNMATTSVYPSPNSHFFITGSEDKTCKVWNIDNGFKFYKNLEDHTAAITSVAYSVDGKYVASTSYDKTCIIWKVGNKSDSIEKQYKNYFII